MSKIEETRREMYRLLAHLKGNPTGVVLMGEFESALEAHLEVLRDVKNDLIVLAADLQQGAQAEADAGDEARNDARKLRRRLKAARDELSQKRAWMRAAVKDNKRLRRDRKAFIQTQAEHLKEIQRLSAYLDRQEGTQGLAGDAMNEEPSPLCAFLVGELQKKAQEFK